MSIKMIPPMPSDEELEDSWVKRRAAGPVGSSACIWYKALESAGGFKMPRTEMVEFSPRDLYPIFDGLPMGPFPEEEMLSACERIGYPVFIRTDLASAKHDGPKSYRADSSEDVMNCVIRTFEDNEMKWIGGNCFAFMVREFLELPAPFVAFGGHPIAREWRFFSTQEESICEHFYWPREAFEGGFGTPDGWQEKLATIEVSPNEISELRSIALRAAQAVGQGDWSVDFAQGANGEWWLIDMARANESWHPEHSSAREQGCTCPGPEYDINCPLHNPKESDEE